jgi:hypothetical protein
MMVIKRFENKVAVGIDDGHKTESRTNVNADR